MNNSNGGSDWREHGVARSQVMKRHVKTKLGSDEIWQYAEKILEENVRKGNIRDDSE